MLMPQAYLRAKFLWPKFSFDLDVIPQRCENNFRDMMITFIHIQLLGVCLLSAMLWHVEW